MEQKPRASAAAVAGRGGEVSGLRYPDGQEMRVGDTWWADGFGERITAALEPGARYPVRTVMPSGPTGGFRASTPQRLLRRASPAGPVEAPLDRYHGGEEPIKGDTVENVARPGELAKVMTAHPFVRHVVGEPFAAYGQAKYWRLLAREGQVPIAQPSGPTTTIKGVAATTIPAPPPAPPRTAETIAAERSKTIRDIDQGIDIRPRAAELRELTGCRVVTLFGSDDPWAYDPVSCEYVAVLIAKGLAETLRFTKAECVDEEGKMDRDLPTRKRRAQALRSVIIRKAKELRGAK